MLCARPLAPRCRQHIRASGEVWRRAIHPEHVRSDIRAKHWHGGGEAMHPLQQVPIASGRSPSCRNVRHLTADHAKTPTFSLRDIADVRNRTQSLVECLKIILCSIIICLPRGRASLAQSSFMESCIFVLAVQIAPRSVDSATLKHTLLVLLFPSHASRGLSDWHGSGSLCVRARLGNLELAGQAHCHSGSAALSPGKMPIRVRDTKIACVATPQPSRAQSHPSLSRAFMPTRLRGTLNAH